MKRATILCGVLAMIGTAGVFWQQQSLSKLHEARNRGFTREVTEVASKPNAGDEQELIALREQTRELPKLRNQVGQWRGQKAEVAAARRENERLMEAKRSGTAVRPPPAGFTSKEQLANVGFATPEDALKTFFWAMNEGDFEMAMHAMSPENRERQRIDKLTPEEREEAAEGFKRDVRDRSMAHFNDFGVRGRENVSDDVVILDVGSSLTTHTMRMSLQRVGNEWRIQDVPK